MNSPPRAWVEVDLGALRRNGAALANRGGVPLLAVIKADGYGLGAVRVAEALEALAPWGFGVATVAEGIELRTAGVRRPILVLSPVLPDEYEAIREAELRPSLGSADAIRRWASRDNAPWHLSIDTGMNRAGAPWLLVAELRDALLAAPPEGAYTHFHSADVNDGSVAEQLRRFARALEAMPARPDYVHAENSPALERANVIVVGPRSTRSLPVRCWRRRGRDSHARAGRSPACARDRPTSGGGR